MSVSERGIAPKKTVHSGPPKAGGLTKCLSKLVSHPRVSRVYSRAESAVALPTSRGCLCLLLDGPLQVIKEQIVREVDLLEHSSLSTFGAESVSRIRSLLQRSIT
ncbi:unnamed protein product [Toxocara canis]|nr:unnamed protein product [Toxocara canis]